MTNALVRREEQTALVPKQSLQELKEVATAVVKSGLAPKGMSPEQLTIVYLKGQEMGMRPMEAQESFYVINGSVSSWTHQLVNRLRSAGHDYTLDETTMDKCTVTFYRRDGGKYTHTLTFAECEAAGYNRSSSGVKPTWKGAGQRWMLVNRTLSSGIKLYCPEVLHQSHQAPAPQGSERLAPVDLSSAWYTYTQQLIESEGLDSTLELVLSIAEGLEAEPDNDDDVIEGEIVETEGGPEPQGSPSGSNGNGQTGTTNAIPPRPYPPETLKQAMAQRLPKLSSEKAPPGHRGAAVGAVEALFLDKPKEAKTAMRHALGLYLFGKATSNEWTHGECQVLLDWAQTRNNHGECDPSEYAAQEALAIVLLMDKAAGQQELPL